MSFQMTLDDMLNVIHSVDGDAGIAPFIEKAEALGNEMAALIAAKLNVQAGASSWDMGMIACPFFPAFKGQVIPEPMEGVDGGGAGDWDDDFDTAPELPEGFIEGEFDIMDVNPRDKIEILMPDGQRQTMMAVEAIRIPGYRAWRKL